MVAYLYLGEGLQARWQKCGYEWGGRCFWLFLTFVLWLI